jgi:hypothetical protein
VCHLVIFKKVWFHAMFCIDHIAGARKFFCCLAELATSPMLSKETRHVMSDFSDLAYERSKFYESTPQRPVQSVGLLTRLKEKIRIVFSFAR